MFFIDYVMNSLLNEMIKNNFLDEKELLTKQIDPNQELSNPLNEYLFKNFSSPTAIMAYVHEKSISFFHNASNPKYLFVTKKEAIEIVLKKKYIIL